MSPRARIAEAQLALMLLTRLPAGRLRDPVPGLAASAWAWPLAGLATGALAAAGLALTRAAGLSEMIAVLVALALGVLATGGLHEDGLADLADGCGGRDPAQRLDIMRDSRIGSFGMLAVVLGLALRAAALLQLAQAGVAVPALIAVAVASRAAMALWAAVLPPARSDGLGHGARAMGPTRLAVALALGAAALLGLSGTAGVALAAALAMLAATAALAGFAKSRLGGQTGDVLGAVQQVAEGAGLLCLAALSAPLPG